MFNHHMENFVVTPVYILIISLASKLRYKKEINFN